MNKSTLSPLVLLLASLTAMGAAGPASAVTTLDFSGSICGSAGDQPCSDNSPIGQSYGDSAAVDVSYRAANTATGATSEDILRYWTTNYGDLEGVVWGGSGPTGTFSEITFAARTGFEVTLLGFESGCYLNIATCQTAPFSILEIGGSTVASGTLVNPVNGHDTELFNLPFSGSGYILRWGPDGYDTGLDNISFDSRPMAPMGVVPEPSTWAMMLFGFGALGLTMRRRRGNGRIGARYAL